MGGVPIWLAIAGAGVGLAAGSLNLVEKVVDLVSPNPISVSERYLLVSVPVNGNYDLGDEVLTQLLSVGDYYPLEVNGFPNLLEGSALQAVSDAYCALGLGSTEEYCKIDEVLVAFYGITNNDENPISSVEVVFSEFRNDDSFHSDEDQGAIIRYFDGDVDDPNCFLNTRSILSDGKCYSFLVANKGAKSMSPLLPGETVLFPLYFGYTFADQRVLDRWFWMPNEFIVNEVHTSRAREMSSIPTIRGTYLDERG